MDVLNNAPDQLKKMVLDFSSVFPKSHFIFLNYLDSIDVAIEAFADKITKIKEEYPKEKREAILKEKINFLVLSRAVEICEMMQKLTDPTFAYSLKLFSSLEKRMTDKDKQLKRQGGRIIAVKGDLCFLVNALEDASAYYSQAFNVLQKNTDDLWCGHVAESIGGVLFLVWATNEMKEPLDPLFYQVLSRTKGLPGGKAASLNSEDRLCEDIFTKFNDAFSYYSRKHYRVLGIVVAMKILHLSALVDKKSAFSDVNRSCHFLSFLLIH